MVSDRNGYSSGSSWTSSGIEKDSESKRAGFGQLQKNSKVPAHGTANQSSKNQSSSANKTTTTTKKDAWGPILKNEAHFKSLHNC